MDKVLWKDMMAAPEYVMSPGSLYVPLGKAESEIACANLHSLRNLLIAGIPGSGKSNLVHAILQALLARNAPERLRLIIVDPKHLEYQPYDALGYLLTPVMTDAKKGLLALKWMNKEAERRLSVLREHSVRSIAAYHEKVVRPAVEGAAVEVMPEAMPYVVCVLEEYSILAAPFKREFEAAISTLAPHAKATGLHLIVTTSRADAQALPVKLREHFPARVAFHMPGGMSRALVGDAGAEDLSETGTALFRPNPMQKAIRITTPFIHEDEIDAHAESLARAFPKMDVEDGYVPVEKYLEEKPYSVFTAMKEDVDDDRFQEAVEAVREVGKASTSYLQRKLGIGYSRAARLIDLLEENGIIGPGSGAAPRDVL